MPALHVLAGVLRRGDGRILLTQRPEGRAHAGYWEFPGGKREPGERRRAALARELHEELGLRITSASPLLRYSWDYPERQVDLDFWLVDAWEGEPESREAQCFEWVAPASLATRELLPANRRVVEWLAQQKGLN
ncbi:MAG: 8-oxo-dGTP diphosphatase MutT [Gammaproteobacteria bacterium]|nr:8-oxo-dGTP diphosphatase MutT [Gammaproteobacteria bacterium]